MMMAIFNGQGHMELSHDEGMAVVECSTGGYLIVGYTWSNSFGQNDIYIIKTDAAGSMIWNKTYGGSQKEIAWDALEIDNANFLLACKTASYGHGMEDVCLMRIDATGNYIS